MREFSIIALTMTLLFSPLSADDGSTALAAAPDTYVTQAVTPCSYSSVKSYMSYKAITNVNSKQYKFIQDHLTVDQTTGLLVDEDGFMAVALGSYFGDIGTKYIFTLDSGIELKLVKAEAKADVDTVGGCYHASDDSVIEFLIDKPVASEYFGVYNNGLVLSGNFNNHEDFKGRIAKIDKVLEDTTRSNVELPF